MLALWMSPVLTLAVYGAEGGSKTDSANVDSTGGHPVLWHDPADLATRDLFYGPGGKEHLPHGTFTFKKEDLKGSNPKYDVKDADGVKWRIKLGPEARPETAATRLVWAVGYFADEDYFTDNVHVEDMPAHLHRGGNQVHNGSMNNVRLKREEHGKKLGTWKWKDDPFSNTREFNGLRVMMALINNWDVKDDNNAIYDEGDGQQRYVVSDLGASFGTAGATIPLSKAKGNLKAYEHSDFITKTTPTYVDFKEPARPSFIWIFSPENYFKRFGLMWIGKNIPRADARWMGDLLGQLSPSQIQDAFRAAGYTPEQIDEFTAVVQKRIAALRAL